MPKVQCLNGSGFIIPLTQFPEWLLVHCILMIIFHRNTEYGLERLSVKERERMKIRGKENDRKKNNRKTKRERVDNSKRETRTVRKKEEII